MGAVELARAERSTSLLAVGGGSVLDGSKFIAAAALRSARDPGTSSRPRGRGGLRHSPGQRADPAGHRFRMNMGAVITLKLRGQAALLLALRDAALRRARPVLTYTLPARQVANGVVDAFIHTLGGTSPTRWMPRCRIASQKGCC